MKYTIYGKANCPSCSDAKRLLEQKELDFEYLQLGKDYSITEFYDIAPMSHKTFPMIALNGEYLGSLNTLQQHLNGDKL